MVSSIHAKGLTFPSFFFWLVGFQPYGSLSPALRQLQAGDHSMQQAPLHVPRTRGGKEEACPRGAAGLHVRGQRAVLLLPGRGAPEETVRRVHDRESDRRRWVRTWALRASIVPPHTAAEYISLQTIQGGMGSAGCAAHRSHRRSAGGLGGQAPYCCPTGTYTAGGPTSCSEGCGSAAAAVPPAAAAGGPRHMPRVEQ